MFVGGCSTDICQSSGNRQQLTPFPAHFPSKHPSPFPPSASRCTTRFASTSVCLLLCCTSVPEVVEPVDEWRVHEEGNKEKRSQGQGKHHAEKVSVLSGDHWGL